jgi:hypothetical protein
VGAALTQPTTPTLSQVGLHCFATATCNSASGFVSSEFPDDANGDVLRRMRAGGDDLSKAREIDFQVVFPDEIAASAFAALFQAKGYKAIVTHAEVAKGLPWDTQVMKHTLPSYSAITAFEAELEHAALPLGGRNDGWGCLRQ